MATIRKVRKYRIDLSAEQIVDSLVNKDRATFFDAYRLVTRSASKDSDAEEVSHLHCVTDSRKISINTYKVYRYIGKGVYAFNVNPCEANTPSPGPQLWGVILLSEGTSMGIHYEIQTKYGPTSDQHERYLLVSCLPELDPDHHFIDQFKVLEDISLDEKYVDLLPLGWI